MPEDLVRIHFECGVDGSRRAGARGDVCVVVDVLRASTTICAALSAGASWVDPVKELPRCAEGVTAGERDGLKLDHADFGNSPAELIETDLDGRGLTLSTTNGTRCIREAVGTQARVLIGSLVNAQAAAERARGLAGSMGTDVTLVLAGRHGSLEEDDLIGGAAIWARLSEVQPSPPRILTDRTFHERFLQCEPARRQIERGNQHDLKVAARLDSMDVVPEYVDGTLRHAPTQTND